MSNLEVLTIKVDRKTRHDLRTAINQILGYSELLEEESKDRGLDGFSADLRKIRAAGRNLMEMIDSVFASIQLQTPLPPEFGGEMMEAPAGEQEPAPETRKGDGSCLLVVDDNEMNRQMLSRRLLKSGYKVHSASGGAEALELIESHHIDLVLLDILMPGISGLETLREIRRKHTLAELPVIMATALDRSEDIIQALRMQANDYVTKPLDFPVVLARVQTQLTLRRLTRMKDEFIRIASHDLKNPLFVILGASRILEEKSADYSHFARMISDRTRQMRRMIEDFLDFQALEDDKIKMEKQPIDLNEIAGRVFEANAAYAAGKGIKLSAELAEGLPLIHADELRLDQVVSNMVSNAIKFSPADTRAVIRTWAEGGRVCFEVSDTGPGLKEEDFGKLFLKYARLSNRPTGDEKSSGLGLSICKQLVDLHGGEIKARNNPDGGTTFSFAIPISAD